MKPHCPNCGHDVPHVNGTGTRCAEPCLCGSGWKPEAPHDPSHIGTAVACSRCRKQKAPRGRSVPPEMGSSLCTDDCPGFYEVPAPGDLWPNESCVDFGYAHTLNATREAWPVDRKGAWGDTLGLFKS